MTRQTTAAGSAFAVDIANVLTEPSSESRDSSLTCQDIIRNGVRRGLSHLICDITLRALHVASSRLSASASPLPIVKVEDRRPANAACETFHCLQLLGLHYTCDAFTSRTSLSLR